MTGSGPLAFESSVPNLLVCVVAVCGLCKRAEIGVVNPDQCSLSRFDLGACVDIEGHECDSDQNDRRGGKRGPDVPMESQRNDLGLCRRKPFVRRLCPRGFGSSNPVRPESRRTPSHSPGQSAFLLQASPAVRALVNVFGDCSRLPARFPQIVPPSDGSSVPPCEPQFLGVRQQMALQFISWPDWSGS